LQNVDALSEKNRQKWGFLSPISFKYAKCKGTFSIADELRREAKFRENRCRDGGERVFGENKKLDAKYNGRSTIK